MSATNGSSLKLSSPAGLAEMFALGISEDPVMEISYELRMVYLYLVSWARLLCPLVGLLLLYFHGRFIVQLMSDAGS